jgi:hypothetical protein
MSFQLNDWYTPRFHGVDDSANQLVLRAAIPFSFGETNHIFRITQPYVTSSPTGATGFADTTVFDLMVFNQSWGRYGVGISGTLPTGNGGTGVASYTAGDLIYYASGTAFTKLGIGAANTVLTSSGSAPQWSTALTLSGNVTAAAFIPSSATIPSNGLFLPAANTVGLATNSTEAWRVDSSQRMMIGTASQNGLLTVAGKTSTGAAATVGNVALDNTQILVTPSGGVFGLDPVCSVSQFQSNGAAASIVLTLNRHVGHIYVGATWSGSGSSTLGGVIFVASNDSGISASIVSQTNFSGLGNFTVSTSGKDLTISMPAAATCYISGCFVGTTVA